jgi:hypothetical protein
MVSSSLLRRYACTGLRGQIRAARFQSTKSQALAPPAPWTRRPLAMISGIATLSVAAYTLGSIYPPSTLTLLFPRAAPGPPSNPTSPEAITYTVELESKLQSLPFLQDLRQREDREEWYEVRPYQNFPEERRVNSLTSGTLRGPGKLALPPLVRVRRDESESYVFVHVGRGLCGHDGIIHGGLLATLLDETLARTVGVHVSLWIVKGVDRLN